MAPDRPVPDLRIGDGVVTDREAAGRSGVETLNQPFEVTIHNVMHSLWTKLNDWLKV
jgi:hypothetical protein